jgi:hypothetical protein
VVKGRPASGKITPSKNSILATLTKREYAEVEACLTPIALLAGTILHDAGAPLSYGYFVNSGIASTLSVMSNGDSWPRFRLPVFKLTH